MTGPIPQPTIPLYTSDRGGGMFQIPSSRLEEVHSLLDHHGVPYWDSPIELTLDGRPPIRTIHLSVKADLKLVRALLDSLA
jgi:hypothetical protein